MFLLAVDTSGKNGSIALARALPGQSEIDVLEVVPLTGGAFSAQLVPQIAALLQKHGQSKRDLGAFAVVSGPGSFTGLRVGLAAIKALAEVLEKPIVSISLLEAVACSGAARGRVFAALDAGRGDAYVGDYDVSPHVHTHARMHSERLLSGEEFVNAAKGKAIVTPDSVLAEKIRAVGIQVELIEYPKGGVLAQLGWEHFQRGETVRPEALEANYLRRSDAEIFAKPARARVWSFMPVAIRSAALNDMPALLAIGQGAPTAAHWTRKQYHNLLDNGFILVAEESSQLRGFVCAHVVAGEWEIENVVVDREFRRSGIANELVRALIQRAQSDSASAVLLEVRESNLPARRLYEKHGFREEGRRPAYYSDPPEDAILYALRFDG